MIDSQDSVPERDPGRWMVLVAASENSDGFLDEIKEHVSALANCLDFLVKERRLIR